MSKLKYTSSYDNNPNSDFGASKTVAKEYKKLLAKEKLQPIMQEMNNQTKSVVTNLNDYSLLLKTITQNLVNAELYLSNPEVSRSKGAGRYIGGAGKEKKASTKTNKGTGAKTIETPEQAYAYLHNKYKNAKVGTRFTPADKKLVTTFKLVKNIGAATNANLILNRLAEENKPEEQVENVDVIPDLLENDDENLLEHTPSKYKSPPPSYGNNPLHSPLLSPWSASPLKATIKEIPSSRNLNATELDDAIEQPRFSNHLQMALSSFQGGDPRQNMNSGEEDEEDNDSLQEINFDGNNNNNGNNDDNFEIFGDDFGYENYAEAGDGNSDDGNDNEEDNDDDGGEDVTLANLINSRENVHIRENFIITLFSNIINQVHKASDFWETNITPNLSDIPKLKMDSFMKSNAINNFEKAIKNFENTATRQTIKTHLDYLDNIYNSLTSALDELFERMNIDIKRYSGGLSSSSDKSQLIGSGFLPFQRSVYSSHLRDSTTKYLM